MIQSIRSFLLFNLFLSVTLVSILSIIGNIFLEHKGFQTHLDSQLMLSAYNLKVFFTNNDSKRTKTEINKIQNELNNITLYLNKLNIEYDDEADDLNLLLKSIQFQVWNKNGKLLLKSFAAPDTNLIKMQNGFHYLWHDDVAWRAFTLNVPEKELYIVVLQRSLLRAELEQQITEDSVLIMLITYPFLAILIWVIVGRSLYSLQVTTAAIKKRSPKNLTLLKSSSTPKEIAPLIEELNKLFIRLKDASIREKRFSSDAAHELRTPLATLKTQIQIELNKKISDNYRQSLQKIEKSVEKSIHVVNQLLTLSKIVPEASINEPKMLNLNNVVSDMIIEILPIADNKNVSIALDTMKSKHMLLGNITSLLILMRNLLDNAIRYSSDNSAIHVVIKERNNQIILDVIDEGPGVPDQLKKRVLERFYRIIGTQKQGSGLGLSIVLQIVKLHKAKLELLDNNPKGLNVRITFYKDFTNIN